MNKFELQPCLIRECCELRKRKAVRPGARIFRDFDLLGIGVEREQDVLQRPGTAQISDAGIVVEGPQAFARALYCFRRRTADRPLADIGEEGLQLLVVTDARMHSSRLSHCPVHEESSLRRRRIATELPGRSKRANERL
jgi:hypothetical protein